VRTELKDESTLGEYGAQAIRRELAASGATALPALRTIGRILERCGALDGRHRRRHPPPPTSWYLPEVAARRSELDSIDGIEGLVIEGGTKVEVLNAVSYRNSQTFDRRHHMACTRFKLKSFDIICHGLSTIEGGGRWPELAIRLAIKYRRDSTDAAERENPAEDSGGVMSVVVTNRQIVFSSGRQAAGVPTCRLHAFYGSFRYRGHQGCTIAGHSC